MAVTAAVLQSTDDGQWEGDLGAAYVRTYRTHWLVVCDSKYDGPQVVLASGMLPALYTTYAAGNDVDAEARLIKKTPKLKSRSNSGNAWTVSCEYSTAVDNNQSNQDPTLRPPTISGSFAQYMKVLDVDIDGKPVQNTVGEQFDPSIEVEDSKPILSVTKLFTSIDFAFFASYKDAVNSDTFTVRGQTFAPDVCKMQSLSFNEVWINGANYFEVTAEMEIKPEKWNPRKIANVGLLARQPNAAGPIGPILADDNSGEPINAPVNLKADGTRAAPGDAPHLIDFRPYIRRPFSLLNLS